MVEKEHERNSGAIAKLKGLFRYLTLALDASGIRTQLSHPKFGVDGKL